MAALPNIDVVYTPEEVAKALKVAGGTIRNLIRRGKLFAIQVGDQYRIPRYAVEQFISPFAGIDWESIGYGMWKGDKNTKVPLRYVRLLRRTRHRSVQEYLADLDADPAT